MKKIFIVFVNIIFIIIILLIFEFIYYYKSFPDWKALPKFNKFLIAYSRLPVRTFHEYYRYIEDADYTKEYIELSYMSDSKDIKFFRSTNPVINGEKLPILLFGASDTYGLYLNEDETFSSRLQKYTDRTVINRGMSGKSIVEMLYMLRNNIDISISRIVEEQPEYIIYTYSADHMRRLYKNCEFMTDVFTGYKKDKKTGELIEKTDSDYWWWHSYFLRNQTYVNLKYDTVPFLKKTELFLLYIISCNKEIKKHFPNSKFVFFVYDGDYDIKPIENRIREYGIEVIYLSELSDIDFEEVPKYKDVTGHPTANAWDDVVPILAKRLNL